jgi:hypothetical protein
VLTPQSPRAAQEQRRLVCFRLAAAGVTVASLSQQ